MTIQILILYTGYQILREYVTYVYGGLTFLSMLVIIYIFNKEENPDFKLAWMVPIAVIPVFGVLFYFLVEVKLVERVMVKRLNEEAEKTQNYIKQDSQVFEMLQRSDANTTNLAHYLYSCGEYPVYSDTEVTYFPVGELMFQEMKVQLEQARTFIFMEYFIVEHGQMWSQILEILERKVKEGIEVRFMYDGMCSLVLLPYSYPKELEKKGIKAKMFSPVKPALSSYQNNRDHRKILVVDGKVAFTGGINLADEYINKKVRFGHWKDTGVMLCGEGAASFTMMFLQMWNISEKKPENYEIYLSPVKKETEGYNGSRGFVIPYGDSPLHKEKIGEQVYLNMIHNAVKSVHIMTPYLILDYEMAQALKFAAKRGVETIIIMPHIPDKKYAFLLAKSHYEELIHAGVQIYEYIPGFVHAKVLTSDYNRAAVGTINLDFRSLYLHFECGVYIYKNYVINEIEADIQETLKQCHKVTVKECRMRPWYEKAAGRILRIFAPLM